MLRSAILAVAAVAVVAVVGTALTSTANAAQFIGRFDYANTPLHLPVWARYNGCGYLYRQLGRGCTFQGK
jgi:hypothetical protein